LLAEAVAHDLPVWFIDHFQFDNQPLLECFAMLAHTVGRYPTLRTGTLVAGQSYRNPALTAKIASTLQFLTGGRFILGDRGGLEGGRVSRLWLPVPAAKVRIEQLEDAVRIIKGLWSPGPVSFAGEHYQVTEAYNEPRADPRRP
jgi:alkanesulfonate monooxygenase SsuD/methylene tetrahydromethanopterin reductase-like flavin-dependent oxidoreductase (luciferase family)